MASSMRGRASRLLDAVVFQTLVNNSTRKLNPSLGQCLIYGVHVNPSSQGFASHAASQRSQSSSLAHKVLKKKCVHGSQPYCQLSTTRHLAVSLLHNPGTVEEFNTHTYDLGVATQDILAMFPDIKKELQSQYDLEEIAEYYFDGRGKAVRPLITVLISRAINIHLHKEERLYESQLRIAKIAEMIHTASLVHDDVIDDADTRRGKPSLKSLYGERRAVMAGNYILSVASTMIARTQNDEVVLILSQVFADLVQGELMQLESKENDNERFAHYLKKTFKKTASLLAYSCKAVAILSGADEKLQEVAFQYGRNVGIAFQIVDDILDFTASSHMIGKPIAADLKLGLATAPVLFACEKYPELNPMIMRRFQEPGDVEKAYELVHKSDGLAQTQFLARQHCQEARRVINSLNPSSEQKALASLSDSLFDRLKSFKLN